MDSILLNLSEHVCLEHNNPTVWSDKEEWVKKYLWETANKRLILTYYKNLNIGDFTGELIKVGEMITLAGIRFWSITTRAFR